MRKLALGFALIPDIAGKHYVCGLNRRINSLYHSKFILKENGYLLPHISLFQGIFEENSIKTIKSVISDIHERFNEKIKVKPIAINVWSNKIFFLDLNKRGLQKLHENIFYKLNCIRDKNSGSADPQNFVDISNQERESFRSYGYPFALKAFRPHFTLGRSDTLNRKKDLDKLCKLLQKDLPLPKHITFDNLVIFNVGVYGRLESIMSQFTLV